MTYVLDQDPANVTGVIVRNLYRIACRYLYSNSKRSQRLFRKTTSSVTLNNPPAVSAMASVTSNYNGSQVSCDGATDGRITVMHGGGTGALTYLLIEMLGNVSGAATGIFTGVPAGTYTVRVSDLNGCNVTTAPVTIIIRYR